jgi:flagellar motor switch protein FliG
MLTGPEKAVVFILSLEEKLAGPIVAELSEEELKKLRLVAATMREVKSDALDMTYRDFVERTSKAVAVPRGGLPYLRRLTVRALGEELQSRTPSRRCSPKSRLSSLPRYWLDSSRWLLRWFSVQCPPSVRPSS